MNGSIKFLNRYLQRVYNYPKPYDWEIIDYNNDITITANDKVVILFKFLTYRDICLNKYQAQTQNSIYLFKRKIIIKINQKDKEHGKNIIINVLPQPIMIDQIFRFNEKNNSKAKIEIPNIFFVDEYFPKKPVLYTKDSQFLLEFDDQNNLIIKTQIPDFKQSIVFQVLVYSDKYLSNLYATWQIDILSINTLLVQTELGVQSTYEFKIIGDQKKRLCKIFSSQPDILNFGPLDDSIFTIYPNKQKLIKCFIKTLQDKQQKVQIKCLDSTSFQELIYQNQVSIYTKLPKIKEIFEFSINPAENQLQKFLYKNKSPQSCIFKFQSSNDQIINIIDYQIYIESEYSENIRFVINPISFQEQLKIYIFANNEENTIYECFMLLITNQEQLPNQQQ